MKRTRKDKRDAASERVCQEVRFQMVAHGGIADNAKLYKLLKKWMNVGKKSTMYLRPK
jgi:hypothetical protein